MSELAYLYLLGLQVLLSDDKTEQWAKDYCKKAGDANDFHQWRSSGNDLYVLLHSLSADPDNEDVKPSNDIHINDALIRSWLRRATGKTHNLFVRMDAMFHITNSAMKSLRRVVSEWDKTDHKEQQDALSKLTQLIHSRAPSNSEVLPQLKKLMKIEEGATAGSTSVASVATVAGGLGAGFNPDEDWRSVYPKKKKPTILRR